MVSFKLSAPGKIILFGEHSVVYGKTAIAASVGLRTHLQFQEKDDKNITINLKSIDLAQSFALDEINEFILNLSTTFDVINPGTIDHDQFLRLTMNFIEKLPNWGLFSDSQRSALTSFIYLLSGISIFTKFHITSGFLIDLTSEISIGSGLGSSASFSVVLAGCFIKYMKNVVSDFDQMLLEDVSQWAFCSERIMHGTPSGLDNYLCTFGSIVQYRKNEKPVFLNLCEEYQVILIDTTVPRQGKIMISNIRTLFNNHTTIVNTILEAMDSVAQNAVHTLASNDTDKNTKLKDLIRINQGLLLTLGVSHPNINKICETASKNNFAAKLTGAGGGGYCIVLLLDRNEEVQLLIDEFEREDFPCILTTLGTSGLKVD